MKVQQQKVVVGIGRLTWNKSERICDRYGFVYLMEFGDSRSIGEPPVVQPHFEAQHINTCVTLVAKVVEARQSTHIGDLFHGVYPRMPSVGQEIVLGSGLLKVQGNHIGAAPFDDDRETMWLDIRALYDAHEQTVELSYIPLEAANG